MGLLGKGLWSYAIALALSFAILALIGQLGTWGMSFVSEGEISTLSVVKNIGLIVAVFTITNTLAKFIQTNPQPISIGATNIPNVFYDEEFVRKQSLADHDLLEQNKVLDLRISEQNALISDMAEQLTRSAIEIDDIKYITDTFIRHHKNASRLVRALTQLQKENDQDWFREFCNNVLSECVTTLTKDRADKSSTLYFVEADELVMVAYNRIEFSSTRERRFRKGEGFAGYIWETEQMAIEETVSESEHFQDEFAPKHSYGSILGCPLRIGNQVLGVLCIQSEQEHGFEKDDLVMTQFYADIAALAYYCHMNNGILQARTPEGGDLEHDHAKGLGYGQENE